jgi:hypothetical protein
VFVVALLLASTGAAIGIGIASLAFVVFLVFEIAALWLVFVKGGRRGWAALIPLYNIYVLLKVVGRPGWWLILYFIPIVAVIVHVIVAVDLGGSFAKGTGFKVGLVFLPMVFVPILGFGAASYAGPAAGGPRAVEVY